MSPTPRRSLRQHVWAALVVGAACRAVCAWVSLSFHGRDDYLHVLQPALLWLQAPQFDWEHSQLPGAGYRSHLLPRLVWLLLCGLRQLGVHSPSATLRGIYLAMGLASLAVIPALVAVAQRYFDAATARRAAWVGALYFPLPYAGTRLLIEAWAMAPLLYSLAWFGGTTRRQAWGSGALLGLACWWRPQVVTAGLGMLLSLWWQRQQLPSWRRCGTFFGLGWLSCMGLQGLFDWYTTGQAWGPLWNNLRINLQPQAHLSRSAPWGYVGLLLLLSLPPLSLWLLPAMARAARQAPHVGAALASFVLCHAWVPHKEDRFLLPIVPLIGLLLAATPSLYAATSRGAPRWWCWLQQRWPQAYKASLGLATLLLALSLTSQSQQNLRAAMLQLNADPQATGLISLGPEVQHFFLERALPWRQDAHPQEAWLLRSLAELQALGAPPNRFLSYASDRPQTELWLRLLDFHCAPPQQQAGWWVDRLLARLNPRRNRRREPTLLYRCEPPAAELVQRANNANPPGGTLLHVTRLTSSQRQWLVDRPAPRLAWPPPTSR